MGNGHPREPAGNNSESDPRARSNNAQPLKAAPSVKQLDGLTCAMKVTDVGGQPRRFSRMRGAPKGPARQLGNRCDIASTAVIAGWLVVTSGLEGPRPAGSNGPLLARLMALCRADTCRLLAHPPAEGHVLRAACDDDLVLLLGWHQIVQSTV